MTEQLKLIPDESVQPVGRKRICYKTLLNERSEEKAKLGVKREMRKIENYLIEKLNIKKIERKYCQTPIEHFKVTAEEREIQAFQEWLKANINFFRKGEQ